MAHVYSQSSSGPAPYSSPASWVSAGNGWVPPSSAVPGGFDVNGETIYVGRALQEGDLVPGKVVPSHGCCYVPWGGREIGHPNYQVLIVSPGCELVWISTSGDQIPTGAVQGGVTTEGDALYIGRHEHEGSWVLGKVQPAHGCLYVPFGGQEVPFASYEILCIKCLPL